MHSSENDVSIDITKLKEQHLSDISVQNVRQHAEDKDKESKEKTQDNLIIHRMTRFCIVF